MASLVARLLGTAGVDYVVSVDLHAPNRGLLSGLGRRPERRSRPDVAPRRKVDPDAVIVSPDMGRVPAEVAATRARVRRLVATDTTDVPRTLDVDVRIGSIAPILASALGSLVETVGAPTTGSRR